MGLAEEEEGAAGARACGKSPKSVGSRGKAGSLRGGKGVRVALCNSARCPGCCHADTVQSDFFKQSHNI